MRRVNKFPTGLKKNQDVSRNTKNGLLVLISTVIKSSFIVKVNSVELIQSHTFATGLSYLMLRAYCRVNSYSSC